MFKNNLVSVSVVTWNSADVLSQCLVSLRSQTYKQLEVIIVDNASHDNSLRIAQTILPEAKIIRNQVNKGYCGGHNKAIMMAQGAFFMPLNPDVQLSPTFVENLIRPFQDDAGIGTVVGKIFLNEMEDSQPLIDETGLFLNKARRQYLRGHGEIDQGQFDTGDYVFGASGAVPLYKRSMLEDVKIEGDYFDTSFFAHKEDVDLSWRAQLLGWRAFYEPSAVAYHRRTFRPASNRGKIQPEVKIHSVKNRYLTILKNEHFSNFLRHCWSIGFYDLMILGYIVLFERSSLAGVAQFLHLLPSTLKKRQIIMRRSKVTAGYIRGLIR